MIDAQLAESSHFKEGQVLNMDFINKLKTKELKEEAHQLNRRTEFKVLSHGYVKGKPIDLSGPQDTSTISGGRLTAKDSVPTKVEAQEAIPEVKNIITGVIHKVTKGETYTTIAKKYQLTVKQLKDINDLKGAEPIREGMDLKITPGGDYSEYDRNFYTLDKEDDSYSKIAKKLNKKASDLKKINKGIDEDKLKAGMKIRVIEEEGNK
jgi:peptidoglycan-associated lipoprotein